MTQSPALLLVVPEKIAAFWQVPLSEIAPDFRTLVLGRDAFAPEEIDYAVAFRPPPGALASLPRLKAIFSLGAGVDGFLLDPEFPRHIPLVRFVDPWMTRDMVQYVVLQALIHHREQRLLDEAQKARQWRQRFPSRTTEATRVGVLGLGELGEAAAKAFAGLGFSVAGWSRTARTLDGVETFSGKEALAPFLARTDILVCLLPLTDETRGLLNAETFALLPRSAFVINAARGGHLIEQDLVSALDGGHLAGAALDVFATEPLPPESPLWSHPKITVTPHVAAMTDPTHAAQSIAEGVRRHLRGEPLQNLVDWSRQY